MTPPTPAEVRAARKAAGLSQTAAAALIHCALRSWQDWEAGRRQMHAAMFELFEVKAAALPDPPTPTCETRP